MEVVGRWAVLVVMEVVVVVEVVVAVVVLVLVLVAHRYHNQIARSSPPSMAAAAGKPLDRMDYYWLISNWCALMAVFDHEVTN